MARRPDASGAGTAGLGTLAVIVCCGGHVLVLGALGALTLGTVVGIGAGVVAAAALVLAVVFRTRRRRSRSPNEGIAR
jgi:Flp pilus assembly protein TadB